MNPYGPCVTHRMVDIYQSTVTWNVGDLKVYHRDPFQITKFSIYISLIYGNN